MISQEVGPVTTDGALRFTLARTVDLVAVSAAPRPAGPGALPDRVRLVDLATASELAELADPGEGDESLDGLVARAEARLGAARLGEARRC